MVSRGEHTQTRPPLLPTCTALLGRPSSRKAASAASAGYRVPFTSKRRAFGRFMPGRERLRRSGGRAAVTVRGRRRRVLRALSASSESWQQSCVYTLAPWGTEAGEPAGRSLERALAHLLLPQLSERGFVAWSRVRSACDRELRQRDTAAPSIGTALSGRCALPAGVSCRLPPPPPSCSTANAAAHVQRLCVCCKVLVLRHASSTGASMLGMQHVCQRASPRGMWEPCGREERGERRKGGARATQRSGRLAAPLGSAGVEGVGVRGWGTRSEDEAS